MTECNEVDVMNELTQARQSLGIGNLADLTGVTVETLRYYEQRGLVQPLGRRPSGYRQYPAESVSLVRFIKRAQGLGFTLSEVEELVGLRNRAWLGDAPRQLRDAAVAKVADIDRRIRELAALKSALTELVTACDTSCAGVEGAAVSALPCPLIEAFDTPNASDKPDAQPTFTRRKRR